MATDSAGNIHLLVNGLLSSDQDLPGVYHFEWDGRNWSSPMPVYEGGWYPSYIHLLIDRGNQLHATWHIEENPWEVTAPHQIWYAHGQSSSPSEIPTVQPTFTPTPEPKIVETVTSTPSPTTSPTPTPTLDPDLLQGSVPPGATQSIYTETDDLLLLVKSVGPVALILTMVLIGVRIWRR
jgi:hypothetical protein